MFKDLELAPPDPILGLTEAFRADDRADKVNLGVGVYQDASGTTPVMRAVRAAERRLAERGETKSYLPIHGAPAYGEHVQRLLLGDVDPAARTAQTPGGTGALRVAGDLIAQTRGKSRIWLPQPSWANHQKVFAAAGHEVTHYAYYDAGRRGVDEQAMLEALKEPGPDDVVLLHGCCHNPTGFDPSPAVWKELVQIANDRGWLPLFDIAYQGLGDGLEEDAGAVRAFAHAVPEMLVASSFSKNFGLYSERAGALSIVAADASAADKVMSHMKRAIRANYSNPPRHAEALVVTVLDDKELTTDWRAELDEMRERMASMRQGLAGQLEAAPSDFSFLLKQRGMFSYTGLTGEQVDRLREEHAIYLVRSGRINVAGLTPKNLDRVGAAVRSVLS